jgi:clan AA aspartic protease (TIGR02281 family)
MAEENWPAFPPVLLEQLREYCQQTGIALQMQVTGHVCKVLLADRQCLLVNYDIKRNRLWLAGGGVAAEYQITDGEWCEIGTKSPLSADFRKALAALINSNPVNARPGTVEQLVSARKPTAMPLDAKPAKHGPSPWWLLVLLPAALIAYRYSQKAPADPAPAHIVDVAPFTVPTSGVGGNPGLDASCENGLPENGRTTRFRGGAQTLTAPVKVSFDNAHDRDLLVYFTEPGSVKPVHSIFLKAKQQAAILVSAGKYELLFVQGSQWCDNKRGFLDGNMVKLNHEFDVSADQPLLLSLQSKGSGPLDFQVFAKDPAAPDAPPPMQIESNGVLELQIQPDGHYYVNSTVDGVPLRFVIDTGATVTMLGKDAVGKIQVQNCVMGKVNTANGLIEACFGTVRELRIGPHVIYNAPVSINPNSEANLLGMSVLGRFKLSSGNGVMRINQ